MIEDNSWKLNRYIKFYLWRIMHDVKLYTKYKPKFRKTPDWNWVQFVEILFSNHKTPISNLIIL